MTDTFHDLIYDWNLGAERAGRPSSKKIQFDDETLRDGLQSPSVTDPSIDEKIRILHFQNDIGVDTSDIGLPGAGPHVQKSVERLAREIVDAKLNVAANCAARTHENDIRPIAEISQRVGIPIEACTFIGSSPIRQFAEEWELDWIIEQSAKAVRFAVGEGLPVMYVTEDTTRASPDTLRQLYSTAIRAGASRVCVADTVGHAIPSGAAAVVRFIAGVVEECGGGIGIDWHGHRDRDFAMANSLAAIEAGAKRVCVCDTVGHATPWGVRNLIRFVRGVVDRVNPEVKIDWHGHSDRGLGVINSIAAIEAGADRIHGSAAGIGERVGNTPIDLLMVNLKLMEWIDNDLQKLPEYVRFVSEAVHISLPDQYPVFGRDAFRTGTGVHAAAIIKAKKKGSEWLADRVYSGVPAGMFGLEQIIEVGPMCGLSNVIYWLDAKGYPQDEGLAKEIFQLAKSTNRVLTDEELHGAARRWSEKRLAS